MVRSRAPIRYITQSGRAGWAGDDEGSGGEGGDDSCGDGEAGDNGCGDDSSGAGDGSDGGDWMVKAPTALQALWLLEPLALTFQ